MTALPAELRARTRVLHAQLDASLPLTAPGLTHEQYVACLSAMLAWLRPTERALLQWLPGRLALAPNRRAPLLETDLGALEAPNPADAPGDRIPVLSCEEHAVGCLYVLEGSALGGQVIGRHLVRTLGITATGGGAYFAAQPAATAVRWQRVCAALEAYQSASLPAITDGAQRTFASLLDWMTDGSAGRRESGH